MGLFRASLLLLILSQCCCHREPEQFHPPEQLPAPGPISASTMVEMSSPGAPDHFVKDISAALEAGAWRWTGKRPAVRQLAAGTIGNKFVADFAVPEATFKQTGPVTITFFVDDHVLAKVNYGTPGTKHFEQAVPAGWLQTANDTVLAGEIDKEYVAEDGTRLGFVLVRMGLER